MIEYLWIVRLSAISIVLHLQAKLRDEYARIGLMGCHYEDIVKEIDSLGHAGAAAQP